EKLENRYRTSPVFAESGNVMARARLPRAADGDGGVVMEARILRVERAVERWRRRAVVMNSKSLIMIGLVVGSTLGSYVPTLWGAGSRQAQAISSPPQGHAPPRQVPWLYAPPQDEGEGGGACPPHEEGVKAAIKRARKLAGG